MPGWLQKFLNTHRPVKLNNSPIRFEPYIDNNVVIYHDAIVLRKQSEELPGFIKTKIWARDMIGDVEW